MNMKMILGGLVILLFVTGPVFYYLLTQWLRKRKKFNILNTFAKENNCRLTQFDQWGNSSIGIGEDGGNLLFFLRNIPGKEIREKVSLEELSGCRVFQNQHSENYHKENILLISRIELILTFKGRIKPDISLEFYNEEYDSLTIWAELNLARKWESILNDSIDKNKKKGKIAGRSITSENDEPTKPFLQPGKSLRRAGSRINKRSNPKKAA